MSTPTPHRIFAYQPALDGVRALAVAAVLLFHGGVSWLPGGFLGVDAFFVLSGFLITSLLLAERAERGRIRLGAFWLRRARRLLPALVLVLVAVVATFRGVLPPVELSLLRADAFASLAYVANWRMIYRGDDYFAQTASPSPLQHTWSLGIEEQFYLIWPLLVAAILAVALTRARAALATLCLLGAGASALAAALLYDPATINRAYFGTDTRAQALLVGAALAALLTGRANTAGQDRRAWPVLTATVAGYLGVVAVAALWLTADGADAWLYRGGFTLGAVAVAGVIAHAMLAPAALVGRILSVTPLVWLGRISYGVYLWHWPLFQFVNAQRTGLHGPGLLAVRLIATLILATVSYVLVEQPIRTGQWPAWLGQARWPVRPSPGLVRLRPVTAGLGATAAIGVSAAFILVATTPPTTSAAANTPAIVLPSVPAGVAPDGARVPPVLRPARKPGNDLRITFLGDSVAWSLGTYLPTQPGLAISVRAIQGCGIARLPDIIQRGDGFTNYPACPTWDARWKRGVKADDPDVAVILLDRWELMDRKLNGVFQHVGQPEYDAYLRKELTLAITIAAARGARVALLTAPYTRRAERPDGGLYDEDLPERVDAWNRLLRDVAAGFPDQVSVIDLNARVCPDGKFTWNIDGLQIRSDGLHFTPDGVRQWIAPWLLPQLAQMAVTANNALARGD
ncbi:MAG TPA: acyltransferase family protein [Micromonosporaceae bacterium]